MNPYFLKNGERREAPKRVFARIEYIEPVDTEGQVVVGLDAVDADWNGFEEGFFNLATAPDRSEQIRDYWLRQFEGGGDGESSFDRLPLFHIELSARIDTDDLLILRRNNFWFELTIDDSGDLPVDVYAGLFSDATTRYIKVISISPPQTTSLQILFDMELWPDASDGDLHDAVSDRCEIEQFWMLDVGQGSANALVCGCGFVQYYFDAGCGVYRNKKTNPAKLDFCVCGEPLIFLSHWDADHWAGAWEDPDLLGMTWIVPRQKIGPKHALFAQAILGAGGTIMVVPSSPQWTMTWPHQPHQPHEPRLTLMRCTGPSNDRNSSGLALVVEESTSGEAWLFTGDASYDVIPHPLPSHLSAVVVPHHGANMGKQVVPSPPGAPSAYTRLLYSFGPDNAHGRTHVRHPVMATVTEHHAAGWGHTVWTLGDPGKLSEKQPVFATAMHGGRHLGGVATGWLGVPFIYLAHSSCTKCMPVNQA
jgi:hypothetical protein